MYVTRAFYCQKDKLIRWSSPNSSRLHGKCDSQDCMNVNRDFVILGLSLSRGRYPSQEAIREKPKANYGLFSNFQWLKAISFPAFFACTTLGFCDIGRS
ncbi:Uncharacterized protein TCM_015632 [Theobroma cacao]|uniref:Uncharacterized protein n=1 Tax=Theobroma cacao TaxID=3641 RepID=A0A061G398_THECC|nr:Uncharacterized protein TCM_015632 [Theobroma cacao]